LTESASRGLTAHAQRHIGTDIAVVVFLEPGARFTPAVFTNQFNRTAHVSIDMLIVLADIFLLVREAPAGLGYEVQVLRRQPDVPVFGVPFTAPLVPRALVRETLLQKRMHTLLLYKQTTR
jgi:hypothetical protein